MIEPSVMLSRMFGNRSPWASLVCILGYGLVLRLSVSACSSFLIDVQDKYLGILTYGIGTAA